MTENAKKAIKIGSLCFLAYLAVYIAKNILGTVAPSMMKEGFSSNAIHTAKAVYFYTYAVGQLINGAIGDKIKAKYMMSFGLAFSGISNFAFAQFSANAGTVGEVPMAAYVAYGCTGFFLAMIYGPMTKIVSENTEMPYTTRCSLGYTIASYLGSPAAGIFAAIFAWQTAFAASSIALVVMAAFVFFFFTLFERKKLIVYGKFQASKKEGGKKGSIKQLFERQIVKFAIIAMITGTIRTTLVTNLSEYFATRLHFSEEAAPLAFSLATLGIASSSFIVIFLYERIGHNLDKTLLIMFTSAAIFFTLTYFVTAPYVNVVLIVLAIMSSNGAATMLWSRYCPSLRDTGIVSGVTGFLDFLSYMAAGTMDLVTPHIVNGFAWDGMMLVCLAFMLIGIAISLPRKKLKKA
jgi:sugar phosphate permease